MDYQSARQRFGNRLQSIRTERGITQEQLAEVIGKSTEHVSLMERGERSPSFEALLDITAALDVSVSALIGEPERDEDIAETLSAAPVAPPLPDPVQETPIVKAQRASDLERLHAAFQGIREMQLLADEYGINDILQDNGGKVLQVLILLGLKISPGREGNDAVDADGNEYELKTVNVALKPNAPITTHHHLNRDILNKYRAVKAWYVAMYAGVELKQIYRVPPGNLEPLFAQWEARIAQTGNALNNPKIPQTYIRSGELVYPKEASGSQ